MFAGNALAGYADVVQQVAGIVHPLPALFDWRMAFREGHGHRPRVTCLSHSDVRRILLQAQGAVEQNQRHACGEDAEGRPRERSATKANQALRYHIAAQRHEKRESVHAGDIGDLNEGKMAILRMAEQRPSKAEKQVSTGQLAPHPDRWNPEPAKYGWAAPHEGGGESSGKAHVRACKNHVHGASTEKVFWERKRKQGR